MTEERTEAGRRGRWQLIDFWEFVWHATIVGLGIAALAFDLKFPPAAGLVIAWSAFWVGVAVEQGR